MFYLPMTQTVNYSETGMARLESESHFARGVMLVTDLPPGALEPLVRQTLARFDPNLTFESIRSMDQQVALRFDQERAVASLAGLFGGVALLLAAIGLYGVTAYTVAQKTNEIGIRMALGASRPMVIGSVLRGAFLRVSVGLVLGLPLAIAAGRLLSHQLYAVSFWDPAALTAAAFALCVCSLIAAWIPAKTAASVAPMSALRSE